MAWYVGMIPLVIAITMQAVYMLRAQCVRRVHMHPVNPLACQVLDLLRALHRGWQQAGQLMRRLR